MNNIILVTLVAVISILTANYLVFAVFQQPTLPPPDGNVPAPINVGPVYQVKSGDLGLNNLRASSVTLGGVTRSSWPTGTGISCTWEGVKCDCRDDSSTWADLALTIGLKCDQGQLTDFHIMNVDISSRATKCPLTAPPGCSPELYNLFSGPPYSLF